MNAARPTLIVCALATLAWTPCAAPATDEKATPAAQTKLDPDLARFIETKRRQTEKYDKDLKLGTPKDVWKFFDAAAAGKISVATNLFATMRDWPGLRAETVARTAPPASSSSSEVESTNSHASVWPILLEVDGALEEFTLWDNTLLHRYGNDIIQSIPTNSIYFGGNDAGQFIIACLSKSNADGQPFFTLTQNALADGMYLDYLHRIYGRRIYTPSHADSERCFQEYLTDAQSRLNHDQQSPNEPRQIRPGEDIRLVEGRVQVSGHVAVMAINGLLTKIIFDKNPEREFYVVESFPLDWMYPHLTPHGLIMKLNRQPLPGISEETLRKDHDFWSRYTEQLIGFPVNYETSVRQICDFVERIYLRKDLKGFQGEVAFATNAAAQKAFSRLRSSISGVYAWRTASAKAPAEQDRMLKEADFAFKQAYALCPYSLEALYRYVNSLVGAGRIDDAILLATTTLKLDPANSQIETLIKELRRISQQRPAP